VRRRRQVQSGDDAVASRPQQLWRSWWRRHRGGVSNRCNRRHQLQTQHAAHSAAACHQQCERARPASVVRRQRQRHCDGPAGERVKRGRAGGSSAEGERTGERAGTVLAAVGATCSRKVETAPVGGLVATARTTTPYASVRALTGPPPRQCAPEPAGRVRLPREWQRTRPRTRAARAARRRPACLPRRAPRGAAQRPAPGHHPAARTRRHRWWPPGEVLGSLRQEGAGDAVACGRQLPHVRKRHDVTPLFPQPRTVRRHRRAIS
jgi:hypothetical protein